MTNSLTHSRPRITVTGVQREDVRNRLLRRADWRFLLPNPVPHKTICFANGSLAKLALLISERTLDGRLDPAKGCDLAIAVDPDGTTFQKAWDALSPGGSLYTEWNSPLAGGPKGVRRRLEAAGFEQVICYWPWPWPSLFGPKFWLPLDVPTVLHYFQANSLRPKAFVSRIGYAVRQAPWLLRLRLGLTLPICVTARKPRIPNKRSQSFTTDRAMSSPHFQWRPSNSCLLDTIKDKWSSWGLGPKPDKLFWLLLTGGPRSTSKVVGLVFADQENRPRLAVKASRVPESVPALAREAATLRAVHSLQPGRIKGVPKVLFCHEHDGLMTLGETALSGQPLWTFLRSDNYREIALKATTWLADLAGQPKPSPRADWWNRLIKPAIEDFRESFGPILDPRMLRETEGILDTLDTLPVVCEHRDFSPWNVLMTDGGELLVLDWESSEFQGLPAMDLIYFLTYLAFYVGGAWRSKRFRKCYRATLATSTLTGRVLRECIGRYISNTGLHPAAVRPLRLLTWILHSRSEYRHFVADVVGRPGREILRRSLFVQLWEEELRYGTQT